MSEELKAKLKKYLLEKGMKEEEADEVFKKVEDDKDEDGDVADDVEEAKKKIAEEGKDEQTEKDRVDESVGEKLEEEGDEDSQDAKDRVDESEGEEKELEEKHEEEAEEEADEAVEEHEEEDEVEEVVEDAHENVQEDRLARLEEKLDKLFEVVMSGKGEDLKDAEAFERAQARYGVNAGVFDAKPEEVAPQRITPKEAVEVLRKIKKG